jgi:hypothetical protein
VQTVVVFQSTTMTQYITYRDDPRKLAEQAYQQGFYVEAIQILHAYLENQAQSLLMLVGCVHFNAEQEDTWGIADSFSFLQCVKALFVLNQITKDQFSEFSEFNSLRNKVVHQIFKEPYEHAHEGVPKDDYDMIFKRTLDQIDFFTRKNEDIIEDPKADEDPLQC